MMQPTYSLIANSGVQLITLRIEIDKNSRFKESFHEWYDPSTGRRFLELVYEKTDESGEKYYYKKEELLVNGHLADPDNEPDVAYLASEGIRPIKVGDAPEEGVEGEFYTLTFDKEVRLGGDRSKTPLGI